MTTATPAEKWLAKVNASLPAPIKPGTVEDEKAFDAYCAGKSASATAAIILAHRAA